MHPFLNPFCWRIIILVGRRACEESAWTHYINTKSESTLKCTDYPFASIFKVMTYKALHGMEPGHLGNCLLPMISSQPIETDSVGVLSVIHLICFFNLFGWLALFSVVCFVLFFYIV